MSRRYVPRAARNDAEHTERAVELRAKAERMAALAGQVADQAVALVGALEPGSGGSRVGGRPSRGTDSPAPLSVHVLDTRVKLEAAVEDLYWVCRSALRRGTNDPRRHLTTTGNGGNTGRTVAQLRWIEASSATVWSTDEGLAKDVELHLLALHGAAASALGDETGTYLLSHTCSTCEQRSLWVDPRSWSVRCSNSSCSTRTGGPPPNPGEARDAHVATESGYSSTIARRDTARPDGGTTQRS